jgi:hypothetical protein
MPNGLAPTVPSVSRGSVTVTWPAVTLSSGAPVAGYVVRRFDASGTEAAVGSSCAGIVAGTTCTEGAVPPGTWTYTDTPAQESWTGGQSPQSNPVRVETVTGPLAVPDSVSGDLAGPTLTVAAPPSGTVGTDIFASSITATLSQTAGASSSGTISFTLYGPSPAAPSTCGGGIDLGSAAVAGDGSYNPPNDFTPSKPGDYWLYAAYSGDSADSAATSSCPPAAEIVVG